MRAPIYLDEAGAWEAICTARRIGAPAPGRRLRLEIGESWLWIDADGGWSIDPMPPQAICLLLDLYLPLALQNGASFTVAHLGQSLDGRIAAANGASRWVTGPEDLLHNHRMRALADAILVGADTVRLDDPQLTVRRCPRRQSGPGRARPDAGSGIRLRPVPRPGRRNPGRDPPRIGAPQRGWAWRRSWASPRTEDGALDCRAGGRAAAPARPLAGSSSKAGGVTVSRFLAQGALDRLQLTVGAVDHRFGSSGHPIAGNPGSGPGPGGLRLRRFALGEDMLFECDFS